jgi:predicted transcriptional regulator
MPDDNSPIPVSVRLPPEVIDGLDKVAAALDRPRSWVILRALRQYLADEGREVLDVQAGIAQLERGEIVDFDEAMKDFEAIVVRAEAKGPGT